MEGTPLNSFSLMTTQSRPSRKLGELLDWCYLRSLGDWQPDLRDLNVLPHAALDLRQLQANNNSTIIEFMEQGEAIKVFESLASSVRLDIYRLLMRQGPEGLVAGEIASTLNIPPTNLSFHLKALTHAGLLGVTPQGRYQRYSANLSLMQDLIEYLTAECCTGNPDQCADLSLPPRNCCEATVNETTS